MLSTVIVTKYCIIKQEKRHVARAYFSDNDNNDAPVEKKRKKDKNNKKRRKKHKRRRRRYSSSSSSDSISDRDVSDHDTKRVTCKRPELFAQNIDRPIVSRRMNLRQAS